MTGGCLTQNRQNFISCVDIVFMGIVHSVAVLFSSTTSLWRTVGLELLEVTTARKKQQVTYTAACVSGVSH